MSSLSECAFRFQEDFLHTIESEIVGIAIFKHQKVFQKKRLKPTPNSIQGSSKRVREKTRNQTPGSDRKRGSKILTQALVSPGVEKNS
ncbi:hypothetical protein CEXT_531261 [Caerostris extrusa]|uniref:Uncharacterized protein n=1 Tax=Caerostris extrusa TaxID=172846 RepID=A0AAV4MLX4_CAEEX|nr:hypothetical protein CEXT_531261 [Caerostris extrusa]